MQSKFQLLTQKYLSNILPTLQEIITLQKQSTPFRKGILELIMKVEEEIPGAGIHYSVVQKDKNLYYYPYPVDSKHESIVRPLRYSLNELGNAYTGRSSVRWSIQASGVHLEGCMKALIGWPSNRKSLGSLAKNRKATRILGEKLTEDIFSFTNLMVNPAKHEYVSKDKLNPVFQFEDALYSHFLARQLGAIILSKMSLLERIEAIRPMPGKKVKYFSGAALSICPTDSV